MEIPKWLKDWLIFIKLIKKLEIRKSTDYCPNVILSKQTFKVGITSLEIKQINAPLRFTKLLFVRLFKVINVSPLFKTKKAYTFTNKTTPYQSKPAHLPEIFWRRVLPTACKNGILGDTPILATLFPINTITGPLHYSKNTKLGAIQSYRVYWVTTNLKTVYAFKTVW